MTVDINALVETKDFRKAEDESWLKTSCDTSLVGGSMEHYDQVVAMSQGMINFALKRMHQLNPDMSNFDGENPLGTGLISAELDPPQILINTDDQNVVVWRTNFKAGTLTFTAENGDKDRHPIDGWSVDVRVPLVMKDFKDAPDDSDEVKEENAKQREFIRETFQLPGDYTPERLYAKFADARWSDISFVGKSFSINGKLESYESWKKRSIENARISIAFESTFKEICVARQIQGLTTIGTRFQLKDVRKVPAERAATFPPVSMVHQGYPYRMPAWSGAPAAWAKGLTQFEDPGSRNCLLYCENTTIRQMQQRMLSINGNFATFGSVNNADSRVEGTFVLSHQLFFERFLLPALQPFVYESQVYPREPTFVYKEGYKNYTITEPYFTGYNPDIGGNWTHEKYKFKLIPDPKDSTRMCYQASVPNARDTPINFNERNNDYNKLWSDGTPYVTVRWDRGGTKIHIDGKMTYQTHITTSNGQTVDPGSHWLVPAITWSHVYQYMTWEMEIDAQPKDGSIHFHLNAADDMVQVTSKDDQNGWHWEVAGTTENIRKEIHDRVTAQMTTFKDTLRKGFEGQLRFNYPGYGQLKFGKSVFNEYGDFIASIKYTDMPPPDPNNRIVIPPPHAQTPRPVDPPENPTGGEAGGFSIGGAPRLTWTGNSPVVASPPEPKKPATPAKSEKDGQETEDDAKGEKGDRASTPPPPPPPPPAPPIDRRVVFSVKGTNTSQQPRYFSQINLAYSGNTRSSSTLMRAIKFVLSRVGSSSSSTDQQTVEFAVTTSDGVTKLNNPQLLSVPLSAHMSDCTVSLTPADGSVIEVPAGGSIIVTAKSLSGPKSSKTYYVEVSEKWCNADGVVTPGAIAGFRARVPFKLA